MSQATTVKEVLEAARWIIANKGWCQGYYGKDKHGMALGSINLATHAVSFCSLGAIEVVTKSNILQYRAEVLLRETIGDSSIGSWNDKSGQTKEQVLKAFDLAIEKSSKL